MAKEHNDIYFDAGWMYENIKKQILDFEKGLDDGTEAAVRLASFGANINMQVERMGYQDPYILYFCGKVKGEEAQLIQHMNHVNFLLVAEKKKDPEKPPRRLGFDCVFEGDSAGETVLDETQNPAKECKEVP